MNCFSGRGLVLSLGAAPSPFWEQDATVQCLENNRLLTSGRKMAAPREEKGFLESRHPVHTQEVGASSFLSKGLEGCCPGAHFTGTVSLILY